ncbi:uncharacterized protein PV09_06675 [Verruconis gallopava]|uniref:Isotrichodermin C-15 hydroxylase n=1 Tax=Verruconis gallopava TaxID=253628 RepID=A0A0D2A4W0_9PEZI|nr:uncharacterized protein PV09_06675 [Verruconis gallopava]KIW01823.1 hypothetical protein PV09_06675 [Verruconis gallopava]
MTQYRDLVANVTSLQALLGSVAAVVAFFIGRLFYNAFFHPLAKYPGPKSWGASELPSILSSVKGNIAWDVAALHEKYGSVVRIAPNELSYNTAQAWSDIYSSRPGLGQMPKHGGPEKNSEGFGRLNMTNATIEDHSRMRRLVAHAFSDKAMREQEPIIQQYVDLLMDKLHERAGQKIDIVSWFNFTTFDLMGDLAFSESFHCLQQSQYHPWISMIFNNLKLMVYGNAARKIPGLTKLLMSITPKKVIEEGQAHMQLAVAQANKRLAMRTDRNDIMSYIIKHNGKETGMSVEEIQANSYVIIIGGSETTATLLSGCVYYLLTNPATLETLVEEIRSSFKSENEITFANVSNLKYLLAVLNEALRCYPPVPGALPRAVPGDKGAIIDGAWVPSGTAVSVYQTAACRSPKNFRDPDAFVPERWLGDARYANDVRDACQPFGYGPRNCVGRNLAYMEMRIILARLLWNFDLELCDESRNWREQKAFILYEKPPLMVKLTVKRR